MDILDTGTDGHARFLDSSNLGAQSAIDLEKGKGTTNDLEFLESGEEDFSGVGMRVCFKVRLK